LAARLRAGLVHDHIQRGQRSLGEAIRRLGEAEHRLLRDHRVKLESLGQLLRALSHQGVLARGFALVRDGAGKPLHRAAETAPGMVVEIEFQDGRRGATIAGEKPAPGKAAQKPAGDTQGRLF
jgi:exodeoxyribonuclease VII large subunit